MQKGDFFRVTVIDDEVKTTKHYSTLVKVSNLFTMTDKYLLSIFKELKKRFIHIIHSSSSLNDIIIEEVTSYDNEVNEMLRNYMKSGKEIIFSSLCHTESVFELNDLLKKISSLVYKTQENLISYNFLELVSDSSIDKVELARLLYKLWKYYENNNSVTINIASMPNCPRAFFYNEPPLRDWLKKKKVTTTEGIFEIRNIDFEDSNKWKCVLFDFVHDRPITLAMKDLPFLEGLKSTDDNNDNGLLNGDIMKALYSMEYDELTCLTSTCIIKVYERWRRAQFIQMNLPFSTNEIQPSETAPVKQKRKKKHDSWR